MMYTRAPNEHKNTIVNIDDKCPLITGVISCIAINISNDAAELGSSNLGILFRGVPNTARNQNKQSPLITKVRSVKPMAAHSNPKGTDIKPRQQLTKNDVIAIFMTIFD